MRPIELITDLKENYGLDIPYHVAWYGKESTTKDLHGDEELSYAHLPWYVDVLKASNVGSHCVLDCGEDGSRFQWIFICFKASIDGFRWCRPMLFIDAKPEGTASIVDLPIELTAAIPQRRESGDFRCRCERIVMNRCKMDTVGILVCYNGNWVKKDNIESYEGGEAKGIIVSRNVTFSELVERIYKIMDAEPTKYSVTLKYSVPVSASVSKQIRVEDNDDVQYFLKYNTDVMASKVTPLVASLKNIEGHGIEGCNGIVSVESSNAPATFVVERRNVAISHNETENGGNGFNWSDWVEEVHFESGENIVADFNQPSNEEEPYSAPILHPHEDSVRNPPLCSVDRCNLNLPGNQVRVKCIQFGLIRSMVGRVYPNKIALLKTISLAAIRGHFRFRTVQSGKRRFCVRCWQVPCPWKLRAYKVGLHEFKVVKYDPLHECDLRFVSSHHPQATAELVSDCVKWRFQDARSIYTAADIKTDVKKKFGVSISYSTAWRSRELAFKTMRGSAEESYSLLPSYCYELERTNPGTLTYIETDAADHFLYFFMSIGACIRGFKSSMRPVIAVDATHLKCKYKGVLFVATAFDGNRNIYPVAFGIGDLETDAAWEWF
ncbi:hypothetical protein Prudu_1456S003400 [Prunus dulcis]|uniref:Transposase MuDR plant domain-containing protein n=1 Tax=Prunus dulcis TaxID=3755 RepID=A0A5H2XV75_PRUDU|nr:hypothetical protein Prudu_1456S003400 [Prunus dulcis]